MVSKLLPELCFFLNVAASKFLEGYTGANTERNAGPVLNSHSTRGYFGCLHLKNRDAIHRSCCHTYLPDGDLTSDVRTSGHKDLQSVEFVVQEGRLWLLQAW